jgi:hypothetical protein
MSISSDFDPDAIIRTASRLPDHPKFSKAEIKRRAEAYLVAPPSAQLMKTYRLTATAGVIALMHIRDLLGIAPRTIRKYVELGVLERLPDRTPKLRTLFFRESHEALRLYTLGPIGHAMAQLESITVPSGYHALYDRITHDLLATHVIVRFLISAQKRGLRWCWRNRYQCALKFRNDWGVEPDGAVLLTNYRTVKQFLYVFEFHNERDGRRSEPKLHRYHEIARLENVTDRLSPWWGRQVPILLVASPFIGPLKGYQAVFADVQGYADRNHFFHAPGFSDATPPHQVFGLPLSLLAKQKEAEIWKDLRGSGCQNIFTGEVFETDAIFFP